VRRTWRKGGGEAGNGVTAVEMVCEVCNIYNLAVLRDEIKELADWGARSFFPISLRWV